MGQAWCKEKSTKVQDSKSPLDRVFLRCAHRIYPGLKEEGSVLGGATQRVTSSEIGYASSPSREVLTRGQSIDSVDRPFHPNDWVDVNLEVPGTPRPSSAMTNLTLDTTLYPPTTLSSTNSSGSNQRNFTPVPPPRHRKKNRGRPLPPKPDEVSRTHVDRLATNNCSKESRNSCHEPLYSSVKLHKTRTDEKKVYEHKVNGTGRVITNIVGSEKTSNSDKISRKKDDRDNSIPKNRSSVSLPNYLEPEASTLDASLGDDDVELRVRKITAAESLPLLIASYAVEGVITSVNDKPEDVTIETRDDDSVTKRSIDEVDFSFDRTRCDDTLNSIVKLDEPRLTSTPMKNNFENDCRTMTTGGGWFLHQDSSPKSEKLEDDETKNFEDNEDSKNSEIDDGTKSCRSAVSLKLEADEYPPNDREDNRTSVERPLESEPEKPGTRTRLKRTLSNESEPFDSYEEKELRTSESATTELRSNSPIKLRNRSISKESLPAEMLEQPEVDDYHDDEKKTPAKTEKLENIEIVDVKSSTNETLESSSKTPPPSPEPKIKPEIFDNDHSTLLKVLRDEAEESNLSSMTPSLTELEAALSDMLERSDDHEKSESQRNIDKSIVNDFQEIDKSLERPIEPKIHQDKNIKKSELPVSLKNILDHGDKSSNREKSLKTIFDDSTIDVDRTNDGERSFESTNTNFVDIALNDCPRATITSLVPPAKPSRLHQIGLEVGSTKPEAMPTPPKRRNRSSASGHSTTIFRENVERSNEIVVTSENLYPNDRLI